MRIVYNVVTGERTEVEDAPIPVAALSADEKVAMYRKAVGDHIDAQATAEGFDSIITAVTYADEPADLVNQAKGLALREWRSLCWEYCRAELTAWQSTGVEPVVEDLIAGLPVLIMP